ISFTINPGESLAIIGTTGSGKSTVSNLITRLYDAPQGEMLIDDTPLQDYNLTSLRRQIGFVPQDIFLFSDTIYNNIGFGLNNVEEEKVIQAARDADVYENILSFPEGLNTRVGERGITLSGGQKQRVSIARAIIRDPRIIILEEALSAVDTKPENTNLHHMKRMMENRTSIIISHRVSAAKLADKIIVLADSEIVEEGPHEAMLERNGFYKNLYEKQMLTDETETA